MKKYLSFGKTLRGCDQFGYEEIELFYPEGETPFINVLGTKEEILIKDPSAIF